MNRLSPLLLSAAAAAVAVAAALPARAQSLDAQRAQIKTAIDSAERGQFNPAQAGGLSQHPLYGWLEYANLRRNIDTVSTAQAQDFLKRYNGQAVATSFRSVWLPAVARRQDWNTLLANWVPTDNVGLRCAQLNARQATGKADAQWVSDAQAIWKSTGKSLPDACDPVFAVLDAKGGLSAELRWARIDAAADEQQPAVMRSA
ncbi:lytic murein transglycosylase, partial [Stenotrophomonas sp. 278]